VALITFYEKPGCINNTRQKKLLKQAGHRLVEMNLLSEPWTAAGLRPYFGEMPVFAWFNASAPRIRSGEIVPERLAEDEALHLMLADPLLIRRPLIRCDGKFMCGFDEDALLCVFGESSPHADGDVQTCTQSGSHPCAISEPLP